ncbi:hypothetical protein SAMN05443637_12436 [Pseudonocardia thermophila]|uniref:Uncharacterized protein n=1 Tax=Pseudonocardia thermophila TaxID=1848 RepID=A0A1M6ZKT7_PSETH|nr:hypothetical protein SAMN05443637_12436 [Pseudonocardia thermophila]
MVTKSRVKAPGPAEDAIAERISELILDAVTHTLSERSPEPGRRYLSAFSGGFTDEQRATELMVTLILVRWLSAARDEVGGDLVEAVLTWIEQELGKRCALRARYTSGPLVDEDSAAQIIRYREGLGPDFLPSMVWQLAAVVALHGDGDPRWLAERVGRSS